MARTRRARRLTRPRVHRPAHRLPAQPRSRYITGGAFIPNGHWPAEYDGGYLFADAATRQRHHVAPQAERDHRLRHPVRHGRRRGHRRHGVRHDERQHRRCTTRSPVGPCARSRGRRRRFVAPGSLAFVAVPPGNRVLDTPAPERWQQAGPRRRHPVRADGRRPGRDQGGAGQLRVRRAEHAGFLTAWAGRSARPLASNLNAVAGEVVANSAVVPVDANGGILLYAYSTAHVVIDVLGFFDVAPQPGQRRPVHRRRPDRASRHPRRRSSATNQYTRGIGAQLPFVRVPVAGRGGLPAIAAMDAAVLVVTAVTAPGNGGGFLSASPGGTPFSGSSNLNTNGAGDIRANLVVVPLGADGTVDLHLLSVPTWWSTSPATSRRRPRRAPGPACST